MHSIGERIRELRKEKRLRQAEVGEILGISGSAYSLYEQDRRSLKAEMLITLCDYYDVSSDYVLGFVDERLSPSDYYDLKKKIDVKKSEVEDKLGEEQNAAEIMELLSRLMKIIR